MGVAFFCGKITESVESGGPGYWGQLGHYGAGMATFSQNQTYGTSGKIYSATDYGQAGFYYRLNYG